jgi:hypothetical protein
MRLAARVALVVGGLVLLAALVPALLPLHASGVSGNALSPVYSDFGWSTYQPMPEHPTLDDFRRAGIEVPQDVVSDRRRLAGALAAVGAVLVLAGWSRRRLRRR